MYCMSLMFTPVHVQESKLQEDRTVYFQFCPSDNREEHIYAGAEWVNGPPRLIGETCLFVKDRGVV